MVGNRRQIGQASQMDLVDVICPTCFERFGVAPPAPDELPVDVDYDCEVCCHPMVIAFAECDGAVTGEARSLVE